MVLAGTGLGLQAKMENSNNGPNQRWTVMEYADAYQIINDQSNGALDVFNGNGKDGTKVITYAFHGGQNQRWDIIENETEQGTYRILSRVPGVQALSIQTATNNPTYNAVIYTYPANQGGVYDQTFQLVAQN